MLGGLTGRIYVATRYRVVDEASGTWEALEKHDVTDQFMAVKAEAEEKFTYTPIGEGSA